MFSRTSAATVVLVLIACPVRPAHSAELKPKTVAAFDRYAHLTEARMDGDSAFLWIDGLPEAERHARLQTVRSGQLAIERLQTRDAGKEIDVPDGLIHHWLGTVFVAGATLDQAVALLQDYDHHAEIYKPNVARSKLLSRDGNVFRVYLRFYMKKVIAVTVNSDHEARFNRRGSDREESRIHSLRIAEVENAGTPQEREKPIGNDGGYLWRLYTYWRFLERDGGTYVQCEAISLTRAIPMGFGWLIGPFVTSIPRDSLTFTLETTRKTLAQRAGTPASQSWVRSQTRSRAWQSRPQ
jgi:hypothetical protein